MRSWLFTFPSLPFSKTSPPGPLTTLVYRTPSRAQRFQFQKPSSANMSSSSSSSSSAKLRSSSSSSFARRSGPRPNDAKSGPKGEPMTPILSASLIVLCPSSPSFSSSTTTTTTPPSGLVTLVLQRSARMGSSFRSALVFPGGAVDLADEDIEDDDLPLPTNNNNNQEQHLLTTLRICALRETFEETGLLLLPSERGGSIGDGLGDGDGGIPWSRAVDHRQAGMSLEQWKGWREKVHKDASLFQPFLSEIATKLGISRTSSTSGSVPIPSFSYHSHWITPSSVVRPGKRFSAHFFLTVLDVPSASSSSGEAGKLVKDLSADGSETLSLRLCPPEELVKEAMSDQLVLYPPQFYLLANLAMLGGCLTTIPPSTSFQDRVRLVVQPLDFSPPSSEHEHGKDHHQVRPTSVEESPRDLPLGVDYAWDRHTPRKEVTGWIKNEDKGVAMDRRKMRISTVEPQALPSLGGNRPRDPSFSFSKEARVQGSSDDGKHTSLNSRRPSDHHQTTEEEEEEEDTPFLFPLVLPGDYRSSSSSTFSPPFPSTSSRPSTTTTRLLPLNRVYVTPRPAEDGGGLITSGAVRRGIANLSDWQIGSCLVDRGLEQEEEERIQEEEGGQDDDDGDGDGDKGERNVIISKGKL